MMICVAVLCNASPNLSPVTLLSVRYGVIAASDPNPVVQEVVYPFFCSLGRRISLVCDYQHRDS